MKKNILLWIDDVRPTPQTNYNTITCRCYSAAVDAIKCLTRMNIPLYISFDHDLGEEKTGYDIAKFIVENQIPQELIHWRIHSANPVGAANIRQLLTHYGYPRMVEG